MKKLQAAQELERAARTFRERNKAYGQNYRMTGEVMKAFHPNGVTQKTAADHELFHLWSLIVVKLTRWVISGFTHHDSIHDAAAYCAMCAAIVKERAK
jgi:hypothetical protein